MRGMMLVILAGAGVVGSVTRHDAPRIKRIETISAANLQAPVTVPYVAPGHSKDYFIYGPWVDAADKVTFLGATQTIVDKKALYNSDGGLLQIKLTAPSGMARGEHDLTIHIACPWVPFTDCANGNITRKVMVLRVGTVSSISPNSGVTAGTPTAFTIYGTGLEVATFYTNRTLMNNTGVQSRTVTTFNFVGSPLCGNSIVVLRDQAEGGDFYPYTGVGSVNSTTQCSYRAPAPAQIICPSGTYYDATTKSCKSSELDQLLQ